MDCSMPDFSVLHHLPELAQSHVHQSVMPSNHLVLCRPLLLLPSIFPCIRVFSNELALCPWQFLSFFLSFFFFLESWLVLIRGSQRFFFRRYLLICQIRFLGLREVIKFAQIHIISSGANTRTHGSLFTIGPVKLPKQVWGTLPLCSVPSALSSCELQPVGTGQLGEEEPQLASSEAETIWCVYMLITLFQTQTFLKASFYGHILELDLFGSHFSSHPFSAYFKRACKAI